MKFSCPETISLSDYDKELLQKIASGIHRILDKIEESAEIFSRPPETMSERLNRELREWRT